jgi:hypothetical protein
MNRSNNARCHLDDCRARRSEHLNGFCPNGSGRSYRPPTRPSRGSTSYSDYEARVIEFMCQAALQGRRYEVGKTQAQLVGSVLRKAQSVRRRIEQLRASKKAAKEAKAAGRL